MRADRSPQHARVRAPLYRRAPRRRAGRRLETWLWTGPLGHLVGGGLDLARALARYLLARARGRAVR
jgi:hypothetical protein